jgi:ketosteroid isomerase-like protein
VSNANAALIERFENSYLAGDIDDVMTILSDDIVVHEPTSVPYAGAHRGKDAFLGLQQQFVAVWDLPDGVELEILPAGDDRVLVLVDGTAIARATGERYRLRIAEVYTVAEERIASIEVFYFDTKLLAQAVGMAPAA